MGIFINSSSNSFQPTALLQTNFFFNYAKIKRKQKKNVVLMFKWNPICSSFFILVSSILRNSELSNVLEQRKFLSYSHLLVSRVS